ncbi:PREDICTED: death-inducer obliterator 1-like isoform X2 [Lupinus angustifolius]|uniref:death-inducer obliterator 1-like isoform X2 n=1 Tax=Lupinus angustifolius TaxID=3871 RepID=UPI00092E9F05|nr:PREDICTED: death-inducer obliterator 1-like isoform X2 [Lupinus angustifolius]
MSNNLVSEPIQSMQMAQLESIVNNVDSSGKQMEMQQQATSNDHVGMSWSQGLPTSIMQSGHRVGAHLNNLGMTHLLLPQKQSLQMGTMPSNMGPQQLLSAPKRKSPMEFSSGSSVSKRVAHVGHRPWLQEVSNTSNKGSMQMQSKSNASKSQHLAAPGKRKTQLESTSGKTGTPRSTNTKNQNAEIKQTSKVQRESSETVRSKMRESLTAALALVSQQDKPVATNSNTLTGASETEDKLKNSSPGTGPASSSIDTALDQKQEISQSVHSSFTAADSVDHVMGEQGKGTTSNEDLSDKCNDYEAGSTNVFNNESILSSMQVLNCDKPDFQSSYTLTTDDVPFSDSFFVKDDLLQGNGLSWVISDMMDMEDPRDCQTAIEQKPEPEELGGGCRETVLLPELLASRIEEELFKLFGGVNKKYKEKGRSLLFNLKDRNNPELRERVMSGEIPPEQLCSMTAEELASKELSQWRIAKAEEHEKMVVLPDSDVDIRRLVKKTHKGEFQVEVEHEDNIPMEEVSGGTTSVARNQRVKKNVEASSSLTQPDLVKGNMSTDGEKNNLQNDNTFSITISSNDGSDPMEGLMTDDALKDPNFLPPIVSLDEFMESLDSEPPFANLPGEPGKVTPISDKDSKVGSKSVSSDLTPAEQVDVNHDKPESEKLQTPGAAEEKRVNSESRGTSSDTIRGESQADMKPTNGHTKERSTDEMKPASSDAELRASQSRSVERFSNNNIYSKTTVPTKDECFWEGVLQVNSNYSVISIFKSGEKTSAKDWPGLLEIKGRVRLDAFEKFLQELRLSRSRAIMVLHFVSKSSSPNTDQSTLREVADSYIVDERVGFAEPVHGVELYFCPPHNKTVEMLSNILPREQTEAVNSIDNGLIGVIVWRKTNLTTSTISPTTSSHHKYTFKRQNSSRRQQDTNVNVNAHPTHNLDPSAETRPMCDDVDDDVPPGFGPPVARIEDDLPEFNFSGSSNPSHVIQKPMGPSIVPYHSVKQSLPSRPAEQMRELVHKYGQNKANVSSVNWQDKFGGTIQPWNDDDDDDIPEWKPQNSQNQIPTQMSMQNFHLRPQMMDQSFPTSHQQPNIPTQYLQPPMNVTHGHGQSNFGTPWNPSAQGSNLQPSVGHPYGVPRQGQGTTWPQNVSRSRGF